VVTESIIDITRTSEEFSDSFNTKKTHHIKTHCPKTQFLFLIYWSDK